MQRRSGHHHRKDRPSRICQRACADRRNGKAGHQPLGTRGIDDGSARHLSDQADQAADRQHKTDLDLGPLLRRQIDRDKRTEAGLHIREKKDEPVEAAQALSRGGRRLVHHRFRRPHRITTAAAGLAAVRIDRVGRLSGCAHQQSASPNPIGHIAMAAGCRRRQAPRSAYPPCIPAPPSPAPWSTRA